MAAVDAIGGMPVEGSTPRLQSNLEVINFSAPTRHARQTRTHLGGMKKLFDHLQNEA